MTTLLSHMTKNLDTETSACMILTTQSGKTVQLSESQFEQWFAAAERACNPKQEAQDNADLSNQFVGRFGLQSAKSVIEFLNSPAGETVKELIHKQIEEMLDYEEQWQEQNQEEQRRLHIRLGHLLMGLLHKREAKAKAMHTSQEATEHQLQQKRLTAEANTEDEHRQKLNDYYDSYSQSMEIMQELIADKQSAMQTLAHQQKSIDDYQEDIRNRHESMDENIAELDTHLASLSGSEEEQLQQIEEKIAEFEQKLAISEQTTAEKIQSLDDPRAQQTLIARQQGLYIQLDGLKGMQSVLQGNKVFLDANGKVTDSYQDALFIVPKNSNTSIVKDQHGNYYVLPANQTLTNMSAEEKSFARDKFKQMQPDLLVAKEFAQHNKKLEKESCKQRQDDFNANHSRQLHQLKNDLHLLQNQVRQMQAARADISIQIANPDLARGGQQQANSSAHTLTAKPASSASLITTLQKLQNNPTIESITDFKNQLIAQHGTQATRVICSTMDKLTPNQTIPPNTLRQLIIKLDLLGLHDYSKIAKQSENKAAMETTKPSVSLGKVC